MGKLNRPPKSKLNRGEFKSSTPWFRKEEYKNYPLHIHEWEEDGIGKTLFYAVCPKHERQIPLDLCIKGIFYFDPKDRKCRSCFALPKKVDYPPVFLNTPKENKVPEAMQILTASKLKKAKERMVEEDES